MYNVGNCGDPSTMGDVNFSGNPCLVGGPVEPTFRDGAPLEGCFAGSSVAKSLPATIEQKTRDFRGLSGETLMGFGQDTPAPALPEVPTMQEITGLIKRNWLLLTIAGLFAYSLWRD